MKRKAQLNEVVWWTDKSGRWSYRQYGVVIEYNRRQRWDRYRVIRTDPIGRNPYGPSIGMDATLFTPTGIMSIRPGVVWRHNQREIERGCVCNCCHHVKGTESEPSDEDQS